MLKLKWTPRKTGAEAQQQKKYSRTKTELNLKTIKLRKMLHFCTKSLESYIAFLRWQHCIFCLW